MEFNPNNNVIKLCIEGMDMEGKGKPEEASRLFLRAWEEATNDFEKFLAAYYVARHQNNVSGKLKWLETALQFALKINDDSVNGAFPSLYLNIAKCYEDLSDLDNAKKNYDLANSWIAVTAKKLTVVIVRFPGKIFIYIRNNYIQSRFNSIRFNPIFFYPISILL